MTATKHVLVEPARYTIYEHEISSPGSDSETDCEVEEWLSVTTVTERSSITSEISTTKPGPHSTQNKSAFSVPEIPPYKGKSLQNSLPQLDETWAARLDPVARAILIEKFAEKTYEPLERLSSLIQNLTAIYFVSAAGVNNPRSQQCWPKGVTLPRDSPIMIVAPHWRETYVQICVDCACPPKTLNCDGTWEQKSVGWCGFHAKAMQVRCNHLPLVSDCGSCAVVKGQEIAALTLEVVQPWARAKLAEAGITVFEYGSGGSGQNSLKYAHKEKCECGARA